MALVYILIILCFNYAVLESLLGKSFSLSSLPVMSLLDWLNITDKLDLLPRYAALSVTLNYIFLDSNYFMKVILDEVFIIIHTIKMTMHKNYRIPKHQIPYLLMTIQHNNVHKHLFRC